jgi:hypothetical protein
LLPTVIELINNKDVFLLARKEAIEVICNMATKGNEDCMLGTFAIKSFEFVEALMNGIDMMQFPSTVMTVLETIEKYLDNEDPEIMTP